MNWWNSIQIESVTLCGIHPFDGEFTFYFPSNQSIMIGKNGSGKTMILRAIEYFFNENKYFKTLVPKDLNLDIAYITIQFRKNDENIWIKKLIKQNRTSVSVFQTEYSTNEFSTDFINYVDKAFVYYFSSERLLTEKDNEFDFIKNSLINYLEINTHNNQEILSLEIKKMLEKYKKEYLIEFNEELDFKYSLNLKTGLGFKLVWKHSPFETLGSGEKKEIALKVLYSYVKSRTKGPSIILIDGIENHFDFQMLQNNLHIINKLSTSLQLITTFSKSVAKILDNYSLSIVDNKQTSNKIQEIFNFLYSNTILF